MYEHPSHNLLKQLIKQASVTPDDKGCQSLIAELLSANGFQINSMPFNKVENLWATHGQGAPVICFAGHTDVVPAGDLSLWHTPPFSATEKDGILYGRGAADMKSGVACMTTALIELVQQMPNHPGTLALLLTSDEEGPAIDGTQAVLDKLYRQDTQINYAIVGEPTCESVLGDTARQGRRGSLHLTLTINGQGGHVAYPEQINNPCYTLALIAEKLSQELWDEGDGSFPPTSFQISNIWAGEGTENVVPATASLMANWRFNALHSAKELQQRCEQLINSILTQQKMTADFTWRVSAQPFITHDKVLLNALSESINVHCQQTVKFNTAGGTSDARFFASYGVNTVEFGPINATIHQANESIAIADIEPLTNVYRDTVSNLWQLLQNQAEVEDD